MTTKKELIKRNEELSLKNATLEISEANLMNQLDDYIQHAMVLKREVNSYSDIVHEMTGKMNEQVYEIDRLNSCLESLTTLTKSQSEFITRELVK